MTRMTQMGRIMNPFLRPICVICVIRVICGFSSTTGRT
jgi:hypothetical protein